MPKLELHIQLQGNHTRPFFVEDEVPTKGMVYTLEENGIEYSYVVTMVRRRLWKKRAYDKSATSQELMPGTHFEVMMARVEDVASGKVVIR